MARKTIEQFVAQQIEDMLQNDKLPVAVMLGHEDWLIFSEQSVVAYTSFGNARRYQPALGDLLMVRVDEMHTARVVTQAELDAFAQTNQIL